MQYKFFAKTGVKVSALCLGAMTLGREADEKESFKILDAFAEAGGNFIDTADVYGEGRSEEIIGNWLKSKKRDDFVIGTKVRFASGPGLNDIGLSRKHIFSSIDASLKRFKTDYVDLYQIHAWDNITDIEETLNTLDSLIKSGKVRYLGASNLKAWQIQKSLDLSDKNYWEKFICLQSMYNLLERGIELEITDVIKSEKLAFIPWSPLRGGWLSGKYKRGMKKPPERTRVEIAGEKGWSESWESYDNEHTWKVIDELFEVSKITGKTLAQISINWIVHKPFVTSAIIGARNVEQLKINLDTTDWSLDKELVERLDKVSDMKFAFYPYSDNYKGKYIRD
ncbi:MAG: aldo/keto reductase [Spirochaetes bacterium]|nr:aldo/keto reductase [Spirochaetota bacterium]